MKVTRERLPESRVVLDIEVDSERLEKSIDAAYKRVSKNARIPGFRPGKAPRQIVERMVGREGLIREALDELVPDAYGQALEQEDVHPVAQPELEIIELDPVRFKATIPVQPTVELNDYRSVRVEREPVEVTDEMVAEQLEMLRQRFATQVPVERPIQWDDVVIGDVVASVEDEPFVEDRDAEFTVREGQTLLVEGLAEAFIGMSRDEEKEIDLDLPEEFPIERLQGKTAHFVLTVKDVKEEQLPELDDDFAQEVNADEFPTLDALKERIRNDIEEQMNRAADSKLQQEAIDKMVEIATLEFPRVMVDREVDELVRENLGNDRDRYMDYLTRIGQSEEEYRASMEEAAETRVKRSLVLLHLSEAESIEVSDEEIEAELDKLVEPAGEEAPKLREMFSTEEGKGTIRRNLLSEKTLARVKEIATLESEASDQAKGEEPPEERPAEAATTEKEDAE